MTFNQKLTQYQDRQDDDHDRALDQAEQDDLLWDEIVMNAGLRATAAYAYARLCEDEPGEVGFREFAVLNLKSQRTPAHTSGWGRVPWVGVRS